MVSIIRQPLKKRKILFTFLIIFVFLVNFERFAWRQPDQICSLRSAPYIPLPEKPPTPALYGTIYSAHTESDWLSTEAEYLQAGFAVPNLIHQSVKVKNKLDIGKSWRTKNPDWVHVVWDEVDMINFVTDVYPDILPYMLALRTLTERSDLWRYLVLFTYGGIFVDQDTYCNDPISTWSWPKTAGLVASVEGQCSEQGREKWLLTGYNQFQTWLMAGRPGHPILRRTVEIVRENMLRECVAPYPHEDRRLRMAFRTGPGAWSDAINEFLRTTGYRDFDVAAGGIMLGNVAFFSVESFREELVRHDFRSARNNYFW
ncbi:hypothetical protein DFS34DRAFT_185994 [Phlyctochytrium arcticum]|nr:hypothetical protein DFS34DRAFT_185994 [Phlyctochytrium arcticum]